MKFQLNNTGKHLLVGYKVIQNDSENIYSPEKLRLLLARSPNNIKVYEIHKSSSNNTYIERKVKKPDEKSCLLYWFRSNNDAENAFNKIIHTIYQKGNFPPVSIQIELARLNTYEMNHCIAYHCYRIFEPLIENWIKSLSYDIIEEEIEQGPFVLDYYKKSAQIINSINIMGQVAR